MRFWKYESIGNDFVLVEANDVLDRNLKDLAVQLCDRKFGIGSDGLLLVDPNVDPILMRMFNPDGSEDFCGNGLRCTALHMKREHGAGDRVEISHGGVNIPIGFTPGGWIDVSLPPPWFDPKVVPIAPGIGEIFEKEIEVGGYTETISTLSTGSTHTVIFKDSVVSEEEFRTVSRALETHRWFPNRTSVIWAWPTGAKSVEIRIWERGVGETLGCGTGSAAVAACWFRKHPNVLALEIRNPGGEVAAAKGAGGRIVVSARARRVYSGTTIESAAAMAG